MKLKKYHLIFGVITGILCAAASGQIERPQVDLIAPPNPVLAGIKQLEVVIITRGIDPNKIGLDSNRLQTEAERRLEKAGIKVFIHNEGTNYNLAISSDLKISIEILNLGDSQQYVFRVQTALSRAVRLDERSDWLFKTDIWTTKPVMQTGQLQNMAGMVTKTALSQVETFIQAYHTANTAGSRLPDANDTSPKELSKAPSKEPVAGYKYVASKNGDVFHTLNCRSAKRISPENIIGYNSRDDAINAGKRPCKVCKP
jgi:micrococcal nuclease